MSNGPEENKLMARLFDDPKKKILNFHVSWGPKAHLCTREELCAELNKSFDQIEDGTATCMTDID